MGNQTSRPKRGTRASDSPGRKVGNAPNEPKKNVLIASGLCRFCQGITIESLSAVDGYEFHKTTQDVVNSAETCPFCDFLMNDSHIVDPVKKKSAGVRVSYAEQYPGMEHVKIGRLYAIPKKGLVYADAVPDFPLRSLSLSLADGSKIEQSHRFNLPIRKRLTNTASPSSSQQVHEWLAQCDSKHACYQKKKGIEDRQCPAARLIDLQAFEKPCLDARLVKSELCQGNDRYITLSHCWGGNLSYITTTENEAQRMDRISYEELPLTFQHAMEVTRNLGIRYLWIDAICIIQGDTGDWNSEAAKMYQVYSRCYLMIAAESSTDSSGGLYNSKSLLQDEEPLGRHVILTNSLSNGETSSLYVSSEHTSLTETELRQSALSRRGWALQEGVLAPRVLHYTSKQIIWECQNEYVAEDIFTRNLQASRTGPPFARIKDTLNKKRGAIKESVLLGLWYDWVISRAYSHRQLTNVSDRLPAIAGLATWTAPAVGPLGGVYIAGMWLQSLTYALTWRREPSLNTGPPIDNYPTFSWASIDGKVSWPYDIDRFEATVKLSQYFIQLEDEKLPFNNLKTCWLELSGFISQFEISLREWWPANSHSHHILHVGFGLDIGFAWVYPDRNALWEQRTTVSCIELGINDGERVRRHFQDKQMVFLILGPREGNPDHYVRLGTCSIGWADDLDSHVPPAWLERYRSNREWRTIRIY